MPPPILDIRRAACGFKAVFSLTLFLTAGQINTTTAAAQYRFDRWTTDDGLPHNAINSILQTRDGYLWLATSDGLARFDGASFKVFNRNITPGIETNRFLSLYEASDSTLWAGSADALLQYSGGRFKTYTMSDGLPNDDIIKIEEDASGDLWFIGVRKGVTLRRGGRFINYDLAGCLPGRIPAADASSGLWWSQDRQSLHFFLNGRLFNVNRSSLPSLKNISALQDRRGRLLIGSGAGSALIVPPLAVASPGSQSSSFWLEDRSGARWRIGNRGVERELNGVTESYPDIRGLSFTFYEDREGSIWIGATEGLYRAREMGIAALTTREGLFSNLTYSVLQDRTGAIWIGSWGGGVSRLYNRAFTHFFLTNPTGLYDTKITSLYEDRDGVIWIGSAGGMSRFKDGKLARYSNEHGLAQVWATYQDRAGDFWFATSAGLTRLRGGQFTIYTMRDGLPYNNVTVLLEDRQGALWIGTYGGLARWKDGRFTRWTEADGLSGNRIRCLFEDTDGALWIGAYDGGMTRLKDGRFTRYTTRDGLSGNGVFQILDDGRGYFWMSSNQGVFRARRRELNDFADGKFKTIVSTLFDKEDGMRNAECNGGRQPAGWKMRDGKLWFPTVEGIAIIDPKNISVNSPPPPVVIEECRLDRGEVAFADELRIPPGEEYLEIHYTGLSFIKPEQIKFEYQLTGHDQDWVAVGNRRVAYFDHLPQGEYVFTVRAANSDGVWNEQGARLRVIVLPHVWQTWWFRALGLLSVAGLVALGYSLRISRLRREHALREEYLRRERVTQEAFSRQLIESQEEERRKIAGELHDELKSELDLINYAAMQCLKRSEADEDARRNLSEISTRATRASAAVAEIIQGLRPQILEAGLTEAIISIVAQANESSETRFAEDIGDIDDALPKELEAHLYLVVWECVVNIIKHAKATEASVSINRTPDGLSLTIQDNGRGFTPDEVSDGFGLTSIARRVEILGGEYAIKSAPGQGAIVTITIEL